MSTSRQWRRRVISALFGASVQAGILEPVDLAGYRNRPVYIRGSHHVPPSHGTLMDRMDTLFGLSEQEESGPAKAVLGHFILAFIALVRTATVASAGS